MAKNLIIYYSRTGENYWNGSVKDIKKGNMEIFAEFIQKAVGLPSTVRMPRGQKVRWQHGPGKNWDKSGAH